ncbi:MAG TPA: hypothetical protein VFU40_06295, partial [Gemmatimonadales bacterium]|nr:hypothetical protein [Gemmatimonadales bacterium]
MSAEWRTTLLQAATSLVIIAIVIGATRARRLSLETYLGLKWPRSWIVLTWVGLFAALVVAEELVAHELGLPVPSLWGDRYQG